jgi:hypothetical protein
MGTRRSHRVAYGVLPLLLGVLVVGTAGGAEAQRAEPEPEVGVASTSSPFVPNVPHVPADVILALGPDGTSDGARFIAPAGSMFNGPVDEVEQRVDGWWAEQMAAGTTPADADQLLASLRW